MITGQRLNKTTETLNRSNTQRYKLLPKNSVERQTYTDSILTEKQAKEKVRKRSLFNENRIKKLVEGGGSHIEVVHLFDEGEDIAIMGETGKINNISPIPENNTEHTSIYTDNEGQPLKHINQLPMPDHLQPLLHMAENQKLSNS